MILLLLAFILVLDALALHLSSLMEQGLSAAMAGRIIAYSLLKVSAVAIPLSILAAALLTSSYLAEHNELLAMQSSGISMYQSIRPLLIWAGGITVLLFLCTFWVIPFANLQLRVSFYEVMHSGEPKAIRPGYFFDAFEDMRIRASRRDENEMLHEVLIYDDREHKEYLIVIVADSARLSKSSNNRFIRLELFHGSRYEEYTEGEESNHGFGRIYFDTLIYPIALPDAGKVEQDKSFFKHHSNLSRKALTREIDSMQQVRLQQPWEQYREDPVRKDLERMFPKYVYELANMYSLPFTALIFMILGFSLGAKVSSRGKGVGVPGLTAVASFMIFYVLKTQGERMAKSGTIDPWLAASLPIIVFSGLAFYLLWHANRS